MSGLDNTLTNLPNIGINLADKLKIVGIESPQSLISVGNENDFARIKVIDNSACINMLYALEGAIQGIRWHNLDNDRKNELKDFFNSI